MAPSETKTEITFLNWLEVEDSTRLIFKQMINQFEQENRDIDVRTESIPFSNYLNKAEEYLESGEIDMLMGNSQMIGPLQSKQLLLPLDSLIPAPVKTDILPANLKGTTFSGRQMAVSWITHPIIMFCNKELFLRAGLNTDTPPETWDEMLAAAEKVSQLGTTETGETIFGIGLPNAKLSHSGAVSLGILYNMGGTFTVDDESTGLLSPVFESFLNFFRETTASGVMASDIDIKEARALFATNRCGIIFDGDFAKNHFRSLSGFGIDFDKNWNAAVIPEGHGGGSVSVFTEHQLAIARNSDKSEAAWRLIEYLISEEALLMYNQSNTVIPPRRSILELPAFSENEYLKVFLEQLPSTEPLPVANPWFEDAMNLLTKTLELAQHSDKPLPELVSELNSAIKALDDN